MLLSVPSPPELHPAARQPELDRRTSQPAAAQEGRKPERFNFWGYSTAAFFAPMARYSSSLAQGGPGQAAAHELKLLVRECHARGIEVIMDIVFNHTAEGNQQGPSISLRSCLPNEP